MTRNDNLQNDIQNECKICEKIIQNYNLRNSGTNDKQCSREWFRMTICKNMIGNDNLLKMIQNTICKFCRECFRKTICKLQMIIIILSNSDHHIILFLPLLYHQQQRGRTLSAILPIYLHQ